MFRCYKRIFILKAFLCALTYQAHATATLTCSGKLHEEVLEELATRQTSREDLGDIVVKEFKRDRKPGEIESGGIVVKPGEALDFKALGLDPYGEYIYVRTTDGHMLISARSPEGATEDAYFMSHRGLVVKARKLFGEGVTFSGAGEVIATDNKVSYLSSKSGYLQGNTASLMDTAKDFEARGQRIYREDKALKDIDALLAAGKKIDKDHVEELIRARKEYEYNNDPKYAGLKKQAEELKAHYNFFLTRYPDKMPEKYEDDRSYYPYEWPIDSMIKIDGPLFYLVPMIPREGMTAFLVKVEENGGEAALEELNTQFRAQRQALGSN